MGLLDGVGAKGLSSMLGGNSGPLLTSLLQMISNQPGGLGGFLQSFQEKGLGGLAASWIGTGQNQSISTDQITHVLGSDQVKSIAAQAGISPEAAGTSLASLLPMLIDHLTPNGQVPQQQHQSNLLEMGMSLLNSLKTGTNG
jgi:uncharacterized protein YidB (DUF937 family)